MKRFILLIPVLSGIMWGSVGIFVRRLTGFGMDNVTILALRSLFAAVILFAGILLWKRELLKIKFRDLWIFLIAGICGMLMLNFCYNEAINRLTVSLAAILLSLSPAFVMVLAAFLFKEKITARKTGCMLLAAAGCVLSSRILESVGISISAAGIAVGICAAFFYGLYSVFSRIGMEKGYHVFTITFYSLLINAAVLLSFADWNISSRFIAEAPVENGIFLLLHGLCTSVLPYVLYTFALTRVETGKASILAAGGEPIAATVFGAVFFGEIPSVLSLLGVLITITALAFFCKEPQKENDGIEEKRSEESIYEI